MMVGRGSVEMTEPLFCMKIAVKNYQNIKSWSNPELAKLLNFVYGNIDQRLPVNVQKVRYDELRRLLNEVFVVPNIEEPQGMSFIDRYNALKGWKFDLSYYKSYVEGLLRLNESVDFIKIVTPYRSKITPKIGLLPFSLEYSTFGLNSLKLALELYEITSN